MDAVSVINTTLAAIGLYLVAGLLFCPLFLLRGAHRVAPRMRGASLGAKLFIAPGICLLWPLLVIQWSRSLSAPVAIRDPHRMTARAHDAP